MSEKKDKPQVMHIDREELYTSLPARIQYLQAFCDFNGSDIEALEAGGKHIKMLIPAVVNIVYKKLLSFDITAQAFTTRSTSYQGAMDTVVDEDSPQIKYRKMFLRAYLLKLCSDPTKMEFWEYLDKVGMMHVGLGRRHPLHVEYIHLGMCLGYVQEIVNEAVINHPKLSLSRKSALIKALGKVIWIQNDLLARWHVRDGNEYAVDDDIEIEAEGYLHGKKVVEDLEEGSDGVTAPSGGCPFAAMAGGAPPPDHPEISG